ncbi:hypothetical protein AA0616_0599 [Komagataeibacter nataicola NRIC 0616]|nr:hypothetical protein AA0616_0599 [Komagataeibacter nataicola NRIC 0616]
MLSVFHPFGAARSRRLQCKDKMAPGGMQPWRPALLDRYRPRSTAGSASRISAAPSPMSDRAPHNP